MSAIERSETFKGTSAGVFSLVAWATAIAFNLGLIKQMGMFTAGAAIYLPAGIFSAIYLWKSGKLGKTLKMPPKYLYICGGLFVGYEIALNAALGLAKNDMAAAQGGLANYLWTAFTLLFSVWILGKKARAFLLYPGCLIAISGIFLSSLVKQKDGVPLSEGFLTGLVENWAVFLAGTLAAVIWGLYSVLSSKFAGKSEGNGAPLFLIGTGIFFLVARQYQCEPLPVMTAVTYWKLAYTMLVPSLGAYMAWDFAMRRGNVPFLATLSYFVPLISTIITCQMEEIPMTWQLWGGGLLVILGAALCQWSLVKKKQMDRSSN